MSLVFELHSQRDNLQGKRHHDSKYTVGAGNESISRSSILRRKYLGCESVQHAVHDIAGEAVAAVPSEQRIR